MLTEQTVTRFLQLRAEYPEVNTPSLLRMIRAEQAEAAGPSLDWHSTPRGEAAAYREGPLLVLVTREEDPDRDSEDIGGTFTNTWEPGAVKHSDGGREYKWWVCDYPFADRVADGRARGLAKQPAFERAARILREEYLAACNPEPCYILSARVYHSEEDPEDVFRYANSTPRPQGALLGRDSCGGYYDPSDREALAVAEEALREAREEVRTLQGLAV